MPHKALNNSSLLNTLFGFFAKRDNSWNSFGDKLISFLYATTVCLFKSIVIAGYINSYDNNTFKPDRNITRQEFAVTLVNLLDLSSLNVVSNKEFNDVGETYGKEAIELLASLGVIQGYPDGTFQPDKEITRAEAIVIINRLIGNRLENTGTGDTQLTDIEDNWAREEIIKAVGK